MYSNSASAVGASGSATVSLAPPNGSKILLIGLSNILNDTFTFPSGFTPLTPLATNNSNNGSNGSLQVAWKDAGASEPSSYVVSSAGAGDLLAIGSYHTGRSLGTAPTYQSTNSASSVYSGAVTIPLTGVTTSAAGNDIVAVMALCVASISESYSFTAPSGYTEQTTANSGYALALGFATRDNVAAGATGTLTGSANSTTGGGDAFGVVIAMPASASGASAAASSTASTSSSVRLGQPGIRVTLRDMDTGALKNAVTYANVYVLIPSNRASVFASFANVTTSAAGIIQLQNQNMQYGAIYDIAGWSLDGSDRFHASAVAIDTSV